MSNIELSNQTVIHNANIQSFGKIVNIVQQELDERNLEYLEFQNIDAQDKGRIVFDIQTLDQKAGKTYVVHVDFMHSAPGVYQFLDCVYGSGSASDLKYLIYDSSPMVDDEITHAKFYFVTRMINKCNAVGIPFKIIDYQNPLEKSNLVDHLSKENPDTVKQHIESGPLPSKWDILRMAFWSILYNTNSGNIYSELHQLRGERSSKINVSGDICVFVQWTDDGIHYVISDKHGSDFISWLWQNRTERLERLTDLSSYRDGANSCICCEVNKITVQKMLEMHWVDLTSLGDELYNGSFHLAAIVKDALRQYKIFKKIEIF
jgi:hypothetical protein